MPRSRQWDLHEIDQEYEQLWIKALARKPAIRRTRYVVNETSGNDKDQRDDR